MATSHRAELQQIRTFPQLIRFLRDEMGWPIESEEYDDLVFDYEAEELGLDAASAAKIKEIKRLRPLAANQPWGIFFVSFEPKRLPVVALRRILSAFVMRKRASANAAERMAWETDDLLFISNFGEGEERQLSFAHFSQDEHGGLPTLRVLGWDNLDTPLHLDHVADQLTEKLAWPRSESDVERWRETWGSAFTLRHGEVIATSKALAVRLAELARAIRERVKSVLAIETDSGPVTHLMKAFKEVLVHDLEADDFADMYAQTVAYGLLSARIANPEAATADGFAGQLPIASPFLKELMETFLHVGGRSGGGAAASPIDFDELGVSEVVELLDSPKTNMEAVVRDFGDKNPQEDPVIHFYEDFLKEYDKKQKVKRGVFYTPRPVVSYIVRSVDELLRSEFGLVDGLADITTWGEMIERHEGLAIPDGVESTAPFVTILDLATGTGTFLVETIDVVHRTLVEKWKREGHGEKEILDLWNDYVPKHLLPRLYGYELLMAPYAIAHLKIGLKLHETGYRFRPDDRLRVYLTNSLEPASDIGQQALTGMLPALAHEAHAVNEVKRHQRFTVVLGNPPYSHLSSNLSPEVMAIVEPYKYIGGKRLVEKGALSFQKNLQDDYVKFIRLAEMTIEATSCGIAGLVTNHSYLTNPTFRGLRYSLMGTFQCAYLIDLHGNSLYREAREGHEDDENVFDIKQGVAISVLCRGSQLDRRPFRRGDYWGSRTSKYGSLSEQRACDELTTELDPGPEFWVFRDEDKRIRAEYEQFVSVVDLFPVNSTGIKTHRDHFAIAFDCETLERRVRAFRDLSVDDAVIADEFGLSDSSAWRLHDRRRSLAARADWASYLMHTIHRPFDYKWIYYDADIVELPRLDTMRHLLPSAQPNVALCFPRNLRESWNHHALVSRAVVHKDALSSLDTCYAAPLFLTHSHDDQLVTEFRPNLSSTARNWLRSVASAVDEAACLKFLGYCYAVLWSDTFAHRYAEFLKTDFPRIPLSTNTEMFETLAQAGNRLSSLHLMESTEPLKSPASYAGPADPLVGKVRWLDDSVWLDASASSSKGTAGSNPAVFIGVHQSIWDFRLGGYQVCEKWLKDRKGRTLSDDDIAHYRWIVAALSETTRLMGEIDEVIEEYGGWPAAFAPTGQDGAGEGG